MKVGFPLPAPAATQRLGAALAGHCPWGSQARVLYLSGELGAGKTTLAAATIASLGVSEAVRSPSYALIEIYQVRSLQLVHVDLYRLQGAQDLEQLGLRDVLDSQTLVLVEWPERARDALPPADISIELSVVPERRADLQSHGEAGDVWLTAALATLS